ncbi:MAG: RDD family protein [Acidobacteriaceae bacterium]|nr:RDD family protein [Acidobacteriaceae bacterium]
MTCQHCQTWILDDDHRCRRCGRRVRSTPSRISPATYPIAATATARAYDFDTAEETRPAAPPAAEPPQPGQQPLFANAVAEPRVIPFDSLTSPAEREAIRSRAAEAARPTPLRNAKVEVRHARAKRVQSADQRRLDFLGQEEVLSQPQTHIICDAPVAPPAMRVQAALIDGLLMAAGCVFGVALFLFEGGNIPADKHLLPFLLAAFVTVPVLYKLLWTFAGRDSIGMQSAGLHLVDFDGNPPSRDRRYQRLFGSFISFLAAGIGLVWALVDEDSLTWHDHMSSTFPTIWSED